MAQKQFSVPITIQVGEKALETMQQMCSDTPVAEALASRCSMFVEALMAGGIMLDSNHVSQVQANYGKPIQTARDVVRASERAADREDGRTKFSFSVDPVYEEPLKDIAKQNGTDLAGYMASVLEFALENQWVASVTIDGKKRVFTAEQEKFFEEFTGFKQFTVRDLVAACSRRGKRKVEVESDKLLEEAAV